MHYEFTVKVTEQMIRGAVKYFWLRAFGPRFATIGVLFPLLAIHDFATGTVSLFTYLLLAGPFVLAVMMLKNFKKHLKKTIENLDGGEIYEVRYVLNEDSLTTVGRSRETSVPWKSFLRVWKRKDYWLLFCSRANYLILPLNGVAPEALAFVTRKIH